MVDNKTTQDDENEKRKSSTVNSMFISTTISKPNVESIIGAVATILHSQMIEVMLINHTLGFSLGQADHAWKWIVFLFWGKVHLRKTWSVWSLKNSFATRNTNSRANTRFCESTLRLRLIFVSFISGNFRPECCIISLVYINRLIAFTEMPLLPTNWRPLVLCSLLVA